MIDSLFFAGATFGTFFLIQYFWQLRSTFFSYLYTHANTYLFTYIEKARQKKKNCCSTSIPFDSAS